MYRMKKGFLVVMALVLLLVSLAFSAQADPVFAFESLEYNVLVKKNIDLKPILQGATLSKKAKYTWESENTDICKVSDKGKVTGVAPGETTVSVSVSDEDGSTYSTSCKVIVLQPVQRISFSQKTVKVSTLSKVQLNPIILPENATNQKLRYVSSDPSICSVSEDGVLSGHVKRKSCTITAISTDGGDVKGKIKVNVVNFIIPTDRIVISERKTYYLILDYMGIGDAYCMRNDLKGCVRYGNLIEDMNNWYNIGSMKVDDPETGEKVTKDVLKIDPVKAGKQTLTIYDVDATWGNGQKENIEIIVEPSATYSDASFPKLNYNQVVSDPDSFVGKTVQISGVITAVEKPTNKERRYAVATKGNNEDMVCAVVPAGYALRNKTYFEAGEKVTIYGIWQEPETTTTETGLTRTRPVLLIEKINDMVLNSDLEVLKVKVN